MKGIDGYAIPPSERYLKLNTDNLFAEYCKWQEKTGMDIGC